MGLAIVVKDANYADENLGKVKFINTDSYKDLNYEDAVTIPWNASFSVSYITPSANDGYQSGFPTDNISSVRFVGGDNPTQLVFYNRTAADMAAITSGRIDEYIVGNAEGDKFGRITIPANTELTIEIPEGSVCFGVRMTNSSKQDLKPAESQYK